MTLQKLDIGDQPRTTYTILLDGENVDPPSVVLIVRAPKVDENTPATEQVSIFGEADQPHPITRASEGVYYADIPLTRAGTWYRRWVAYDENGAPIDAFEQSFNVSRSHVATPLPDVA